MFTVMLFAAALAAQPEDDIGNEIVAGKVAELVICAHLQATTQQLQATSDTLARTSVDDADMAAALRTVAAHIKGDALRARDVREEAADRERRGKLLLGMARDAAIVVIKSRKEVPRCTVAR